MPTLFVIVMICSAAAQVCDIKTARAYQAFAAPPGIIICGVPATMTVLQSAVGPNEREFVKVKCVLR